MIISRTEAWSGRLLLVVLMVVTIVPFISLFTTALHPSGSVPPGLSWPADPQWGNFLEAFDQAHMDALLTSSVLIVLGVVPVSVVIATMAGFAIGHLHIRGSSFLFVLFLLGLTLPLAGIIIPLYYLADSLHILDTKLAIILPLIGLYMPFGVFWMRAHFVNMPHELSEAARVDGATTSDLFWKIHVPLAMPAISSLAILLSVWTWNQFLLALVHGAGPARADHGRRPRCLPGSLRDQHPTPLCRIPVDPDAHPHRLHHLPAAVRLSPAPGLAEGLR